MGKLQVRRLKTKDLFTVATIIGKCGQDFLLLAGSIISQLTGVKNKKDNRFQLVGAAIFTSALKYAGTDIKSWLADLVGKKLDEFDELEFDATLKIIEKLSQQEDLKSFFDSALALGKTLSGNYLSLFKTDFIGQMRKS